ncbi:hypothetical protein J6590_027194 [Homalodisca vitripennis]|nr:hypothetical protein J6590_027194 [Homalodisca vitripennis]
MIDHSEKIITSDFFGDRRLKEPLRDSSETILQQVTLKQAVISSHSTLAVVSQCAHSSNPDWRLGKVDWRINGVLSTLFEYAFSIRHLALADEESTRITN